MKKAPMDTKTQPKTRPPKFPIRLTVVSAVVALILFVALPRVLWSMGEISSSPRLLIRGEVVGSWVLSRERTAGARDWLPADFTLNIQDARFPTFEHSHFPAGDLWKGVMIIDGSRLKVACEFRQKEPSGFVLNVEPSASGPSQLHLWLDSWSPLFGEARTSPKDVLFVTGSGGGSLYTAAYSRVE